MLFHVHFFTLCIFYACKMIAIRHSNYYLAAGCKVIKKKKNGVLIEEIPNVTSFSIKHVFQEWTRVRIGDKWYDISEKRDWWSNVKINKVNGVWTSDIQKIGNGIEEQ